MPYIILRDTFGDGLEIIPDIGIDVYNDDELDDAICYSARYIVDEDGYEDLNSYIDDHKDVPIEETLVICEIKNSVFIRTDEEEYDIDVRKHIKNVLQEQIKKENEKEYKQYLKLKKKFEKETP